MRLPTLLLFLCLSVIGKGAPLPLTKEGKTSYQIVVAQDASEAERFAAEELSRYLKMITGVTFPIASLGEASTPALHVGMGAAKPQHRARLEGTSDDTILLQSDEGDIYLLGAGPRGALYAVYEFLEAHLGCQWWSSTEETIPSRATLSLPAIDKLYTPRFDYRSAYFSDLLENPTFAAKLRSNAVGHQVPYPPKVGGSRTIVGFVHTFAEFLPPQRYFPQHPEWGGLHNGVRTSWEQLKGQPCLSNPEMTKEFTRQVLNRLEGASPRSMISVSQNDNSYRCTCERCLAIEGKEQSRSGPIIAFVNKIAGDVAKERPDVLVETLAYLYSVKPPAHLRPAPNVLIRLCSYLDDHSVPLSHPRNRAFQQSLEGWSGIARQLHVWDYTTDFENQWKLRPNLSNLADNIRTFAASPKVTGVFSQGAFNQRTDFVALRAWLIAKLLWDPTQDEAKLIEEFLSGYYGEAAPALAGYLKSIEETARTAPLVMSGGGISQIRFPALFFEKADVFFAQAQAAVAHDPEKLRRVRIEGLAPQYLRIHRYPELRAEGEELFSTPEEAAAACDQFIKEAEALGIDLERSIGGAGSTRRLLLLSKIRTRPTLPIPPEMAQGDALLDFPAPQLMLYRYGALTKLVEDPGTATGYSATLPAHRLDWGIQLPATPAMSGKGWRAIFRIRYDGSGEVEFSIGGYDAQNEIKLPTTVGRLTREDGYQVFSVTVPHLEGSDFLYLAPNPQSDTDRDGLLYVDRIVLEPH